MLHLLLLLLLLRLPAGTGQLTKQWPAWQVALGLAVATALPPGTLCSNEPIGTISIQQR
jgi:hypothetical protein